MHKYKSCSIRQIQDQRQLWSAALARVLNNFVTGVPQKHSFLSCLVYLCTHCPRQDLEMPPVIIEELDDDLTPEQHLDHLLRFHEGDAKKLLATTFAHLKRTTSFFEDPEASKVLARLLRNTKGPAAKAAQPSTPAQSSPNVSLAKSIIRAVTFSPTGF